MEKIRIGIAGYGNLGRGVQLAVSKNADMKLVGVFTRRAPEQVATALPAKVYGMDALGEYEQKIDVLVLCGGSATDLPKQGPELLARFNTVDSFDTHARIPEYLGVMEQAGKKSGHLAAISIGWDPGLFSLSRALFSAYVPEGKDYTFWGRGVSQGHSDAVRRIPGVKNAVQYTVPSENALRRVRAGENPELSVREKHTRECYVVLEEGADPEKVKEAICTMPNYFADYDTTVHFISVEEMKESHAAMPHGGSVLRSAASAAGSKFMLETAIRLDSNPEFTGSILAAYARAVARLRAEGKTGAVTVLDVPAVYLSPKSRESQIASLL